MRQLPASFIVPQSPANSLTLAGSHGVELADGRVVVIAPIEARDCAAERAFVSALSLTSRYRRFHFGLRELTPEASLAMTAVDQQHEVAFVARPAGVVDAPIVADARYVLHADAGDAEFAIAVADDWQGAGLGRLLLCEIAVQARKRGVHRLVGDVLWGNTPMIGLVRSLGGRMQRHPGDSTVVRAVFELDTADVLVA